MQAPTLAPPIKALFIYNHNPLVVHPDQNRMRRGLAREDLFTVGSDVVMTDSLAYADVVLPAACAYEKSGTFTNTCGDLQMLRKAGEVEGAKSDFEIIVRIAAEMGHDIRTLVPFGRPLRADMGQSRGAQSAGPARGSSTSGG